MSYIEISLENILTPLVKSSATSSLITRVPQMMVRLEYWQIQY